MKTIRSALSGMAALGLILVTATAQAGERPPGAKLFMEKTCMACHGKDGRKAIQGFPNLAGQDKAYLLAQTMDIIRGKRTASPDETGHPRTQGMVGALINPEGKETTSQEDITLIVDWLSKLEPAKPVPPATPLDPERVKKGGELYVKLGCLACHGKEGMKPLKGYPFLAGQKRDYLLNQVKDIKGGIRINGKSKMMAASGGLKRASDEDLEMVSEYLSQIDRTGK